MAPARGLRDSCLPRGRLPGAPEAEYTRARRFRAKTGLPRSLSPAGGHAIDRGDKLDGWRAQGCFAEVASGGRAAPVLPEKPPHDIQVGFEAVAADAVPGPRH